MLHRADTWNVTAAEGAAVMGCDALVAGPLRRMTRAVDVAAPAHAVWPWLGMLRVAPYSYDLIDNLGRRSPRTLDSTLPPLAPGQRILQMFVVDAVEEGRSFTARGAGRFDGRVAMTYAVAPLDPERSRLLARMVVPERSRAREALNGLLAAGDLVMMRRQLWTLAELARRCGPRPLTATKPMTQDAADLGPGHV